MPRDTLTRKRIVKAGHRPAGRRRPGRPELRALGRRLGSAATAIYWLVGSNNLVALAADQAWHVIALLA